MPRKIVTYPHPALRHPAVPVTILDKEIRTLAGELVETMYAHSGAGLAAPQLAVPYQMFVMNLALGEEDAEPRYEVVVNPLILERGGVVVEAEEGCLSFPKLFQKVRRPKQVKVQGINLEGQTFEKTLVDLPARVFQHEFDHLHGRLFIDYFGVVAKLASKQDLATFTKDFQRDQEKKRYPSNKEILRQLRKLEEELAQRTKQAAGAVVM
jgi:peptide deformylase